jgi:6-phosphofructokinase
VHRFRIGVLTSGGDCPGLNAVIRAAVASAHTLGWEVLGFIDGYEGLLSPVNYKILTLENTQGIMPIGGTIIGTTNRGRFVAKQGLGEKAMIPQPIIDEAKQNGVSVVGVPKTIDNDLSATATTFGFDSAVQCVADALDRLHTTAASHKRVMVLEVMGRHAGWIALHGGLAGGADVILIPEIPFSYERLAAHVEKRMSGGAASTLIVAAEGASPQGTGVLTLDGGTKGEVRLGGIGAQVSYEIGHLQRGGAPTTQDRNLGTRFGVGAVQLIQEKKFGCMVSYLNYQIGAVTIKEAVGQIKHVPPDGQMVTTAKAVGINFGT